MVQRDAVARNQTHPAGMPLTIFLINIARACQRTCPVGSWYRGVRQSSQLHPLTQVRHNHPLEGDIRL